MDQGETRKSAMDLDELERQLGQPAVVRPSGSDPLAELARLVAEGEAAGRPVRTDDNFDELFEDFLRGGASAPQSEPAPVSYAQDLTSEPATHSAQAVHVADPSPVSALDLGDYAAPLSPPVASATAMSAAGSSEAGPPANLPFEDMLREFEAAMRDAGGERAAAMPQPDPIPAPPQAGWGYAEAGMVVGAAAAAAASSTSSISPQSVQQPSQPLLEPAPLPPSTGRRGIMLAAGVLGVAAIGVVSLFAFSGNRGPSAPTNVPTIAAAPGVTKERPANPGGAEMPNQDKEVLQSRSQTARLPERVAPREEQPLDLTAAPRPADGQGVIRQIPGVAIVAPVSTTPPNGAVANPAAPPTPRPVASVPITIVGEPTPIGTSPPPPPAASAAPPRSLTMPALPPSPPPAAAPAAPPVSTPAAPPRTPTASPSPPSSGAAPATAAAAPAEPRRVRAVPIRAEEGASPSRGQPQPRVVAAPGTPAAPEPSAENAPLRLTPGGGANAGSSRIAAAAPPAATATTPPATTASSGGSFAVQLAAEGSEDSARSKFNQLRSRHASVLGGQSPSIQEAAVNGRSVYRVRVGGMSREEAVSLCERLKANGGSCFVARN